MKLFRLCLVDGAMNDASGHIVAQRLGRSRRRGARRTLAAFFRLVRLDRDRHQAVVETASRLPADFLKDIRAQLLRRYGPGLRITFTNVPDLIGGIRVRVGSDVYDGSVRAHLAALEAGL